MNKPPPRSNRRPSARYARRQRQLAAQRPSLLARIKGLKGRARVLFFSVIGVALLAIIGGTGGTAYALNQENHDNFCASCHTQPESKYYEQSVAQTATTLASFHTPKNVRCIDCHSGSGPLGRISGLTQGVQDLVSFYSGNYHNPAIVTNKLGDDSCLKCHGDVTSRTDFNNHFHRFLPQWQSLDPNAAHCVDCHTGHGAGDPTQQYLVVAQVQQVCQQCHSTLRE